MLLAFELVDLRRYVEGGTTITAMTTTITTTMTTTTARTTTITTITIRETLRAAVFA